MLIKLTPVNGNSWGMFAKRNPGFHDVEVKREDGELYFRGPIFRKWFNQNRDNPHVEWVDEKEWIYMSHNMYELVTPLDIVKERLK